MLSTMFASSTVCCKHDLASSELKKSDTDFRHCETALKTCPRAYQFKDFTIIHIPKSNVLHMYLQGSLTAYSFTSQVQIALYNELEDCNGECLNASVTQNHTLTRL